jgi:hypothetical protein
LYSLYAAFKLREATLARIDVYAARNSAECVYWNKHGSQERRTISDV